MILGGFYCYVYLRNRRFRGSGGRELLVVKRNIYGYNKIVYEVFINRIYNYWGVWLNNRGYI